MEAIAIYEVFFQSKNEKHGAAAGSLEQTTASSFPLYSLHIGSCTTQPIVSDQSSEIFDIELLVFCTKNTSNNEGKNK